MLNVFHKSPNKMAKTLSGERTNGGIGKQKLQLQPVIRGLLIIDPSGNCSEKEQKEKAEERKGEERKGKKWRAVEPSPSLESAPFRHRLITPATSPRSPFSPSFFPPCFAHQSHLFFLPPTIAPSKGVPFLWPIATPLHLYLTQSARHRTLLLL